MSSGGGAELYGPGSLAGGGKQMTGRPLLGFVFSAKLGKQFGGKHSDCYLCAPLKEQERPVRLRARTPPFHGGDTGSNPVRATLTVSPRNRTS